MCESYINIHAHRNNSVSKIENCLTIFNLDIYELPIQNKNEFYSAGLHPWSLLKCDSNWFEELKNRAICSDVIAIGECGLDRNIEVDLSFQGDVFSRQIQLANELRKPIIVHAVRTFYEVISILKKYKNSMPVIYHGYNNSLQIAKNLIANQGYISFGKSLLQFKNNTSEIFRKIPIEKIFLESDDSEIPIEKIYEKAALLLNIEVEDLINKIQQNFKLVFDK